MRLANGQVGTRFRLRRKAQPVFSLQGFIGQDQERQYFFIRQQEGLLLNLDTLCIPKIEPGVGADLRKL